MGTSAAKDIKSCVLKMLEKKDSLNMIFAVAPSQNEVLKSLAFDKEIPWQRVNAFHMDEYIGLPCDAPQGFGNFLKEHIFSIANFKSVSYIDVTAPDVEAESLRYAELLKQYPVDIVVMGIGENGHLAFNDPPVADFNDKKTVKTVQLDSICRQQQVNDGCFLVLDDVPKTAITLTVPTLMSGKRFFCIVPAKSKAKAVRDTLLDSISETCPASILRRHAGAVLYLDADSSVLLGDKI